MNLRVLSILLTMGVASCGYHLVGQGDGSGAIPADVVTVSIQAKDAVAKPLAAGLKKQLLLYGGDYRFIDEKEKSETDRHAEIRIENASESFVPSAYDTTGIASQYRMTLRAGVRIFRGGEAIWESGVFSVSGNVYVTSGPAGIEASHERIRKDLRKEWILSAAGRIKSGF